MNRGGKFSPRAKRSHAYMIEVQVAARKVGLRLPLEPTETHPVRVDIYPTHANRRHPDGDNIFKLVADALCYGGRGDKFLHGYFSAPRYAETPDEVGVVVIIGAEEILR